MLSFSEYDELYGPHGLGGKMSGSDDDDLCGLAEPSLGGLPAAEPAADRKPPSDEEEEEENSGEEEELHESGGCQCLACDTKDTDDCPIARVNGKKTTIRWARYRTKKVKRGGMKKRVKITAGLWCRICYNLWRNHHKTQFPDLGKCGEKIQACSAFKKKFKGRRVTYIEKKGGGAIRIRSVKAVAKKVTTAKQELLEPETEFWELPDYEKEFGPVKGTNAK
eukprot:4916714-Pyramimonas_sp.AAC.1